MSKEMVVEKSWEEFRSSGLFWFANQMLHAFGWSIVLVFDGGVVVKAYPARVRYRGFTSEIDTDGYIRVAEYMRDNCEDILEEACE